MSAEYRRKNGQSSAAEVALSVVYTIEIMLLAVALAMDATAVAATRGFIASRLSFLDACRVALFFGGFQALMPLVGWLIGDWLGPRVTAWSHWIAFVLLAGIGTKMIWDSRSPDKPDHNANPFGLGVMTLLALATSIDALVAGVTLPMMRAPLVVSVATIGITTAVLSVLGLYAGKRFGSAFGSRLDVFGGSVLIGLGAKAVLQHWLR